LHHSPPVCRAFNFGFLKNDLKPTLARFQNDLFSKTSVSVLNQDTRLIRMPLITYPSDTFAQEGWVKLEFIVGTNGKTKNIKILNSYPPRVFDRNAIQVIDKAHYSPRIIRGQKVEDTIIYTIEFKLDSNSNSNANENL
jgi:TonB family protein